MPGAGSLTAANYLYSVAKPDGLTMGFFTPGLFFNQLIGAKEVQFDWAKFVWLGSPEQTQRIIYIRGDSPFKTIEDMRGAAEGPRCGATALGTVGHYFPRLVEEASGGEIQSRPRLSRRGGNRSGDSKERSAVPRRQFGRLLRQRAEQELGEEWLCPGADHRRRQARSRGLPTSPRSMS